MHKIDHINPIYTKVFKYMGYAITSLFVIEVTLKLVFLFKEFIRSKLEMFDALVVYVFFAVECFSIRNESLESLGQLLVLSFLLNDHVRYK